MKYINFLGNDLDHYFAGKVNYDGLREFCLTENLDVGYARLEVAKVISSKIRKRK